MITLSNNSLWGKSGGQLEYVSQRVEHRQRKDGQFFPVIIIRFTDHDVHWGADKDLIEGKYYELEFPIY